ncbi:Asp23/Gls24 family envelope stress response protein [Streptomyces sp. NPDC056105]|uniref:Asp23/Gls24 family envelope stress response protein n=1 Tax=Streptomyces sp. NPDC056105 TaxID=3345714 RepID=UPI0035E2A50A
MTTPQTPAPADVHRAQTAQKSSDATPMSNGATSANEPALTTRGKTSIADVVVVKIAAMAAREIPGVHDMGGGLSRTIGSVRGRVPGGGTNVGRGVKVEVGEKQTAIDLDLVVEYGVSITDTAGDVRENVITAVELTTGLEVVEVNIAVNDVHLPEDDATEPSEARLG